MENNNTKLDFSGIDAVEVVSLNDSVSAAFVNVPRHYTIDAVSKRIAVPGGADGEELVSWGGNNREPYDLIKMLRGEEVSAQNNFFNQKLCYAAGLQLHDKATLQPTEDEEIVKWMRRTRLSKTFFGLCVDIQTYFCAVAVVILSNDHKRINRIYRKEMCHCRVSPVSASRRYVYYADWSKNPSGDDIERIPLLDEDDPIGDLMQRMGREPSGEDGLTADAEEGNKYAVFVKIPTIDSTTYPIPPYTATFRGGSYEQLQIVTALKKALLKNAASVKYLVEIERGYWEKEATKKGIVDPKELKEFVKQRKEEIKKYISGRENQGMMLFSEYYVDPNKMEVHDIKITRLDTKHEGGDWNDDYTTAANILCYAFGIHPNLAGAAPGKAQSNNSGSDKRELLAIVEILQISFHDMLKEIFYIPIEYNGWNVKPVIPLLLPTTLDKHADVEQVTA